MAKEIIVNSAHHFNWVNIGAAINHPDQGKVLDLSASINEETGLTDARVKIYPSSGYGDGTMLRRILAAEKPDALMMFTDPRYWFWLFNMEREIRSQIPIIYYNIWDNLPYPMYNKSYYKSCDGLFGISKQTVNINRVVLGEDANGKVIKYIPHGVSMKYFPIPADDEKLKEFRARVLGDKFRDNTDFILLYNARNLGRKKVSDLILAWDKCQSSGKVSPTACLVLHTDPVDNAGTDLPAVIRDCVNPKTRIVIDGRRYSTEEMNLLYNMADGVILVSSAEGWGLSLTEALVTGKMIIAPVSGGMQDQMRFTKDGEWINFTKDFPSNHTGLVKECGRWAIPMLPSVRHCVGSPVTPYIYDDQVNTDDIVEAINILFTLGPVERALRGNEGREWAISDEAGFTAKQMGRRMIEGIEEVFENFKEHPRARYEFFKIGDRPSNKVDYNPIDYKL